MPFPVPWDAEGLDLVRTRSAAPEGLVLCSAHLPLVKVACRALMDSGIRVDAAITENPSVVDSIAIWGRADRMPAIRADRNVLLKARTLLTSGGTVLLLADTSPGGPFSPHIFELVERVRARVILFSTELRHDGVVSIRFFPADGPRTAQLNALCAEVERIRRQEPLHAREGSPSVYLTQRTL